MNLQAAIDRQDSAGYNHVQGYTAREEGHIASRLQYHLIDAQEDVLKDPRMIAQALESFDYSDQCHFESLISILMGADRENVEAAHETVAEFLRSKLQKQIQALAEQRLEDELMEAA